MTVTNTVCGFTGCGESQEHPMHHGEDKIHDFVQGESVPRCACGHFSDEHKRTFQAVTQVSVPRGWTPTLNVGFGACGHCDCATFNFTGYAPRSVEF